MGKIASAHKDNNIIIAQKRGGIKMIPGYDEWKTTPPQEPEPETYCAECGAPLYEGDALYTIDGGVCEDCLEDSYRKTL